MKAMSRIEGKPGDGSQTPQAMMKESGEAMDAALARFREEIDRSIDRFWRGPWGMFPFSLFNEAMPWPEIRAPWGGAAAGAWPAIDVTEDEKAITVRADVPGLEQKDIAVEVAGDLLTIRGAREEEHTEKNGKVTRQERRFGSFERAITLPAYTDPDKVEATYEKGTLKVVIPRRPGAGPKRVQVKPAS